MRLFHGSDASPKEISREASANFAQSGEACFGWFSSSHEYASQYGPARCYDVEVSGRILNLRPITKGDPILPMREWKAILSRFGIRLEIEAGFEDEECKFWDMLDGRDRAFDIHCNLNEALLASGAGAIKAYEEFYSGYYLVQAPVLGLIRGRAIRRGA